MGCGAGGASHAALRRSLLIEIKIRHRAVRKRRPATAVDVDSDDDPETIREQLRAARRVSPRGDEPRPQLTDSSEMPAALLKTTPPLRTAGDRPQAVRPRRRTHFRCRSGVLLLPGNV